MTSGKELLCLLLLYHTGGALELIVPPTHQARVGSNTQIPCKYKVEKLPVDVRFFAIHWYKGRKIILSYDDIVTKTDPRYSLVPKTALTGVADLSISNVSGFDVGVYTCSVIYSPLKVEKKIQLDIQAPPQIQITNKVIAANEESVLRSSITGFYPEDIDIKWFRDGEILNKVTVDKPQRNPDGTYSVNSSVVITPTEEDRERIFSCRVQHQSLNVPLQEDFQLVYGVSPQIVITNNIISVNKESVLRSSISGFYPKDIDIKWFRDGEILDKIIVDKPERNPDGMYSVNSSVIITPTEEDRERIFSCRVQHQSLCEPLQNDFYLMYKDVTDNSTLIITVVIFSVFVIGLVIALILLHSLHKRQSATRETRENSEMTSLINSNKSKTKGNLPHKKIGKIELETLVLDKNATLRCNISNYIAVKHTVKWFTRQECTGKLIPVSSDCKKYADVRIYEQPGHRPIYTACLTFSPVLRSDDGTEFLCRVKLLDSEHMIQSSTGPLHVTGNLPDPEIGEIEVEDLILDEKATFRCNISNYIVGKHTVKWFKQEKDSDEPIAGSYDRSKCVDVITHEQSGDQHIYTACLTFAPVKKSDDGAEFICRVEHPGSENPIESSIGPVHVTDTPETTKRQNASQNEQCPPQQNPTALQEEDNTFGFPKNVIPEGSAVSLELQSSVLKQVQVQTLQERDTESLGENNGILSPENESPEQEYNAEVEAQSNELSVGQDSDKGHGASINDDLEAEIQTPDKTI
ncbi:uncharacterized protein LOC142098452 [Mixophyes fleayi]|uniref:uncharacterized protein LOC142098452 n=1 Tax=Mixophyes fleayi TaxID=3061075 RepID=UPI003F4E3B45